VENPSHTKPAISLHVYVPPYDKCQTFDEKTAKKGSCSVVFDSIDGKKINFSSKFD
jgi:cysteine dioxygenase